MVSNLMHHVFAKPNLKALKWLLSIFHILNQIEIDYLIMYLSEIKYLFTFNFISLESGTTEATPSRVSTYFSDGQGT